MAIPVLQTTILLLDVSNGGLLLTDIYILPLGHGLLLLPPSLLPPPRLQIPQKGLSGGK